MQWIKIAALLIVWGFFTGFLMTTYEKEVVKQQLSVPVGRAKGLYNIIVLLVINAKILLQ